MGGAYETHVQGQTASPNPETIHQINGIDIEFHQSGGFVHFHDRTGGVLKVVIPVATFDRLLRDQIAFGRKVTCLDPEYNTVLIITPHLKGKTVTCIYEMREVSFEESFTKLWHFGKNK